MRVRKKKILTKTQLGAMTTEPIAQPSNEASTGTDKRKGRDRQKAVALANTPGIVEGIIDTILKKGKGEGEGNGRGRSTAKGGDKGNGSRGNSPQLKNKFIWSGNRWCCNEPRHDRDSCEKCKKFLAANNGKKQ